MHAVVYLRQSQDRDGTSLAIDRQREDCLRLCADRGWTVVEVIADNDVSATARRRRPGYERVLDLIDRRAVDVAVAWHVDRLVRRLVDLEDLIERCEATGVRIATVSGDVDLSTDAGRLVGRILASVARGEVERKSVRQRRAQMQAAQQGRRVGGRRPFGYEQDGVTIRLGEAQAIRDGYAAVLSGVPLAAIAREWNSRGLTTGQAGWKGERRGRPSPWRPDSVRHVLLNARYAGLRAYRGEVIGPAVWPAIVSEATWRAAVALLSDPARRKPARSGVALLTGIALCGVCGATVHGGRTRGGARNYRCRSAYGHVGRAAEPVDAYVSDVMVARLSRPDAVGLLTADASPDVEELRAEAVALRARLDEIAVMLAEGELTRAQARTATGRARARLVEVESAMADAGRLDALGPLVYAEDVAAVWGSMSTGRRRAVVDMLAVVRLMPPGRGTRAFRPETVRIEWRQG